VFEKINDKKVFIKLGFIRNFRPTRFREIGSCQSCLEKGVTAALMTSQTSITKIMNASCSFSRTLRIGVTTIWGRFYELV
jgi:hypothetical protein